ncbi:hypothetical protein ACEPAI_7061 [Sanghuangporus weigelae]
MLRSSSQSTARLVASVPAFYRLSVQGHSGNRRNVLRWTSQTSVPLTAARKSSLIRPPQYERLAKFHTSPPRRHPFFAGLLASILKGSASLEVARTVTKIALTFLPIVAVKNFMTRKYLKKIIKHHPELAYKRDEVERHLRKSIISYRFLVAVPIVLFGLTFLASLERTPLSGRWRVILLSPEEEESILKQLQGDGWYRAVLEVISQDGPPNIIPPTDWRYQVVESVLRRLEDTIPILAAEKSADLPWPDRNPGDIPFPPPAKYPLKPRPRAKEYLRWFCDTMCCEEEQPPAATTSDTVDSPHLIPGPPYNLVLVDRPDCDNAFSFGFGPDGGGGIVVYSGFLDRVFGDGFASTIENPSPLPQVPAQSRSIASEFMGSLLAFSRPISSPVPQPQRPLTSVPREPTEKQLTQIAILLAHELSHLILAHHLESLSAGTVFLPGTVSIFSDLVRAVVFPITMIFGPFVNDAVANWGRIGAGEFVKLSEYCTSVAMEYEADAVSTRILAHAGFDARAAIKFWMHRRDSELSECSPSLEVERARYFVDKHASVSPGDDSYSDLATRLVRRIMSAAHPAHEARLLRLKSELHRWETERLKALKKRAKKAKKEQKKKRAQG